MSRLSSERSESGINTDVLLSSGAVDMTNLRRRMSSGEKIKRMIMSHNTRRKPSIKKGAEMHNNTARSPKRDLSKQIEKMTQGMPLSPKSMRPEEPTIDN